MPGPSDAICAYIHAKDGNRPWLMQRAFVERAALEMVVRTDAISFPSEASGREAITDVLVHRISREFENVYTFCVASPAETDSLQFSCDWLVAMSQKGTGDIRVGCGRYDWLFHSGDRFLVERLTITIERMRVLASECLDPIMSWVAGLPYPWCPVEVATKGMPTLPGLADIAGYIVRR